MGVSDDVEVMAYTVHDQHEGVRLIHKPITAKLTKKRLEWFRSKLTNHYNKLFQKKVLIAFMYKQGMCD